MTEYHARYSGNGVMIYWHVEKKSLCVYSQLKSCSASEVAAMIEGVLRHCTSIEIDRNYVDTHGQSLVGFAFAHLLGFRLLPRFKTIGTQKLARVEAAGTPELANLAPMPTSRPIDWELISQQYDQMVKYATARHCRLVLLSSVGPGRSTASAMEISKFLAALREDDDRALLETSTQRRDRRSADPSGHQPDRADRVWPDDALPFLADGNELLHLQYSMERYYSKRIMACTEPSSQDVLLELAYLRVVELQFRRGEPDMGFSARELAFVLAAVRRLPQERRSDPHVLEIGCGAGNLLGSLAEHGILNLRGIDLASAAVERARERLRPWGLQDRVTRSTPEYLVNNGDVGSYDLVLLCDVIEHVPPNRTGAFLAAIRRLVREDGLLVVVTPSALTGPHDVTQHFCPPDTPPEGLHLREYTLRDLTAMLREAGFDGFMGTDIVFSTLGLRPRLSSLSISVKMRLEGVLNATPRAVREQVVNGLYYAGVAARPGLSS